MRRLSVSAYVFLNTVFALGLQAEPLSYTQDAQEKVIEVQNITFAPSHPEICKEKKQPSPAEEPKPIPVPKVVETPLPVPAPVAVPESDSDGDGIVDSKDKCPDTPHGYIVDPLGCPVHVTLHINFAFDSSVLPASANEDVTKLTRVLQDNPPAKIMIEGHTDSVGKDAYNQKLSERRAASLAKQLVDNGIPAERIQYSGKGEKQPIATNTTKEGRAQNRRIEIELQ